MEFVICDLYTHGLVDYNLIMTEGRLVRVHTKLVEPDLISSDNAWRYVKLRAEGTRI